MTSSSQPVISSVKVHQHQPETGRLEDDALDAISEIHTRTVDVLAGNDTMISKAEPDIRQTVERFRDLHRNQAGRLANMLVAHHREPNEDGSIMGTLNQAVVTVRSWFDDIDADVMAQVRSGEQHVIEAFDDALGRVAGSNRRHELANMRSELSNLLEQTCPGS